MKTRANEPLAEAMRHRDFYVQDGDLDHLRRCIRKSCKAMEKCTSASQRMAAAELFLSAEYILHGEVGATAFVCGKAYLDECEITTYRARC